LVTKPVKSCLIGKIYEVETVLCYRNVLERDWAYTNTRVSAIKDSFEKAQKEAASWKPIENKTICGHCYGGVSREGDY